MSLRTGRSVLAACGALALVATISAQAVSPKARSGIAGGTYLQLRQQAISELRGFEDARNMESSPRTLALEALESQLQRTGQGDVGALRASLINPSATNAVTWTEIGPMPLGLGQTEGVSNPVTGRVTALEIDPTNTSRLYLGTAQGGVWRSLDGGASWIPIFDSAQSLAIGALALAPSNPNILYVGTGEANGSGDSYSGVGLYRIDNPATTATLVGPINPIRNYTAGDGVTAVSAGVFTGRSVSKILVHPTNAGMLFVGIAGGIIGAGSDAPFGGAIPPLAMRGLYRLTNAAGTLASINAVKLAVTAAGSGFDTPNTGNRNVNDMTFPDPANPDALVVWINGTTTAGDGGVYRSTNATTTATFTQTFATTVSSARASFAAYKQAAAPTNVVYAATGESSSGTSCADINQSGALRVSTDGGTTWSAKLAGGGGFCGGQCFYNIGIDVRPGATAVVSDDSLWLGGNVSSATCQRLNAKSINGGVTFTNAATGLHADAHVIKVDPTNANIVYHGNDGGIFKSVDGGSTWASLNVAPLSSIQFQSIATHPANANFTIGGTQDNGTSMYTTAAAWNRIDFGDGGYARIDQSVTSTTTPILYHTYFNQTNGLIGFGRNTTTACATQGQWAFKGRYGGSVSTAVYCDGSTDTFNGISLTDAVNFYAPLELGPGSPNTVYFGTDRLYRSTNRGDTMVAVSQGPIVTGVPIRTLHVSPLNDNFRIVGLNNGRVFATTTGAATLLEVTGNLPTPLKQVLRVVLDPRDATGNVAYVSLGGYWGNATGHVFKTTNLTAGAATTWIARSGSGVTAIPDIPVNCLLVDPYDSNALYACTDIGVYYSADGGVAWNPLAAGLPRVPVFEMAFSAGTTGSRVLRIATHGRGMWEIVPPAACILDVDGNGVHDASTDGIMILRAMFGLTGAAVTNGAIGSGAKRTTWAEIQPAIHALSLDIDGNNITDPLSDGLMILRSMLGLTGNAVTAGSLGSGTLSRGNWPAIRNYLNGSCSTQFAL